MTIQTRILTETRSLNFADLFEDGCDVRLIQGADCRVRAALPDRTLLALDSVYSGRLKPCDFRFEYCGLPSAERALA